MPNGIDLILADHQKVSGLFTDFNSNPSGVTAGLIVDALTAHDDAEHGALYPLSMELIDDSELIGRFDQAHVLIKRILDRLRGLEGQPVIDAIAELQTAVSEHVADEETNLLPWITGAATLAQLDEIGVRILQVKQRL